jgi:hypothetical protein
LIVGRVGTMTVRKSANADVLHWLLEPESPGVRYLALRDLVDDVRPSELRAARKKAHEAGPISTVLGRMEKQGYWAAPGPGYNPKYRSSVWAVILLAQLGADVETEPRIRTACSYLCDQALLPGGQFSASGTASGTADCLQGNLCWALLELGYDDPRLEAAFDWMARSVTGEGVAPATDRQASVRYYAGKCGPTFACGSNNKQPCAWGGVKVLLALGRLPTERRTPLIKRAIRHGVEFMFSVDPGQASYPSGWNAKPSGNWWKFGFPVFYVTDLLQLVESLVVLGYANDRRLAHALDIIRAKQDQDGRWPLEYAYAGKTWGDFGRKKSQSKWVTLRALRVLRAVEAG